jgi:hypothetical protein
VPRRQAYAVAAGAAAAYAVVAAAAAAVGFRFSIPWVVVQLLDRRELARAPATALLALHAQPPALNALLAAALRLDAAAGGGPELWLAPLFFLAGGLVVVLLGLLAWRLSGSLALAVAAAVLAAADPALHVYRSVYFYELPLAALLLVALGAGLCFLASGRELYVLAFVLAVGGMSLLRSLYHPLWAAALLALLLLGRARLAPGGLRAAVGVRSAVLLAVLAGVWPLKNALLFGAPLSSSWGGYHLSRGTPVENPALWGYLESGAVPEASAREWRRRAPEFLADAPALSAPLKATGHRNWNHYLFLLTGRELAIDALRWRLEHPREWLRQAAANYLLWGRASYVDAYWGTPRGPDHPLYRSYACWHARLVFPDLRPLVERLTPGAGVHALTRVWGGPAPYTLFALAGLPFFLAASALLLARRLRPSAAARPQDWGGSACPGDPALGAGRPLPDRRHGGQPHALRREPLRAARSELARGGRPATAPGSVAVS